MLPLFLLLLPGAGVCRITLENTHSVTTSCQNPAAQGYHLRIRQISAYCKGPIDRQIRTVRLETRIHSSGGDDHQHTTFLQLRSREIRTPEVYAEYSGSQLADVLAAGGTRISATVTAGLGAPEPPITCEIRFQGTQVRF